MSAETNVSGTGDRRILLVSDQSRDRLVRGSLGEGVAARLLYQRCREARTQNLVGQDYVRALSAPAGNTLAFCVCDGVGSSYKGDFAATFLAVRLVDWLDGLDGVPSADEPFETRLRTRLAQWAAEAQAELMAQGTPPETEAMVREVLEDLRGEYGSETVFFAGRVDRIAGSAAVRAVFCWMGNVSAYVFISALEGMYIRPADDAVRWSTGRGLRGTPSVRLFTLESMERLLIHTDGCDVLSEELVFLSDDELRERCEAQLATPANDDMAMLDIRWATSSPAASSRKRRGTEK
ncbi:MAG TPA: hypothetical protein VKQ30_12090 [Ktedonobacterales bacterium]|nr:hypothetical protein [Ktedonobacterales bacterium]